MRIESQLQLARRVPEYKIKKLSFVNSGEEITLKGQKALEFLYNRHPEMLENILQKCLNKGYIYFHKHSKSDEVNNYDIQRKP